MKRPRLNILRTFESAGRYASFSLAAKELNITQAAVSQQIRQLENYLDANLFIRHHRRLTLTNTGQTYLEAVHEALDRLDSVTDQLFPGRKHQTVSLHCTSSVATLWLVPHLQSFQKHHPDIELRITTLDQSYATQNASKADIEIFIPTKVSDNEPGIEKLLTSTIVPVCSPMLFADEQRIQHPECVLKYKLIHVIGYNNDWHRWFRCYGLKNIEIPRGLSVDSSLIALEAVQKGDGIMLARRPFIDRQLKSGELIEAFENPFYLQTDYYLRYSDTLLKQGAIQKAVHWLTKLAS